MNVAEILTKHGLAPAFAPAAPEHRNHSGAAQTLVQSHAPAAPTAPAEKSSPATKTAKAVQAVHADTRAALLALVDRLGTDRSIVVRIPSAELPLWASVPADALREYLLAADDAATRQAGKVPLDDTAAIHCAHCGPVYVNPDIAAVLPVVDGWARAIGCPWCAIRKAGGYLPRPRIICETCMHWKLDGINPAAGVSTCASNHGTHYPMQRHCCGDFQPDGDNGVNRD